MGSSHRPMPRPASAAPPQHRPAVLRQRGSSRPGRPARPAPAPWPPDRGGTGAGRSPSSPVRSSPAAVQHQQTGPELCRATQPSALCAASCSQSISRTLPSSVLPSSFASPRRSSSRAAQEATQRTRVSGCSASISHTMRPLPVPAGRTSAARQPCCKAAAAARQAALFESCTKIDISFSAPPGGSEIVFSAKKKCACAKRTALPALRLRSFSLKC